jgi:formamidopyrimidine-DNA glycosylase
MPELPEVETARAGLEPLLVGRTIRGAVVRVPGLRWPIAPGLGELLSGREILAVGRRAKYLLVGCRGGTLILHLGMSGHLRVVAGDTPAGKHDHIDILLDDGRLLRFHDPRRFGALLWTAADPARHPLLLEMGPEPFAVELDGDYLYQRSRGRKVAVKVFLMDQKVLVGVGNIYASEALFRARICPLAPAGTIGRERYGQLLAAVREVLVEAIAAGGTTLRDFRDQGGRPGYFARQLQVYGREGEACPRCGLPIRQRRLGQRSTYYCPACQKR